MRLLGPALQPHLPLTAQRRPPAPGGATPAAFAAGRFLSIEGISGAGKTTLVRRLAAALEERGASVVRTRDPGGTHVGRAIRALLLDQPRPLCPEAEVALFFADRAQNLDEVIRPALEAGRTVIADRFTDSTLAYQGAGRGISRELILAVDQAITGGMRPDLTLVLDVPAEVGLARLRRRDRIEREEVHFHERVRHEFLEIASERFGRVIVVDATGSPDEVFESTRDLVWGWFR